MTQEQAVALYESKFWEELTLIQRALFQMREDRLCMPFDVFHEAVEKTLGRPVFTHEFAMNRDGLLAELEGHGPTPTIYEVMQLIPQDKRVIMVKAPASDVQD